METNFPADMPQGNDCPNAITAEVRGKSTQRKSHLAGLQAQGRPGIQAGRQLTHDLWSWQVPAGSHGMLQTMAHWHHGREKRFLAKRLHPSGGRDMANPLPTCGDSWPR